MASSKHSRLRRARRLSIERFERRELLTTLELLPVADNTLFEDATGNDSNGAGAGLFVGRVAPRAGSEIRRGLIRFDMAGSIPANATINSVSMELTMSKTIAGAQPVSLHAALADWGQGGSVATGNGGGIAGQAQTDDATWLHTKFPGTMWAAAGGDFVAQASSTTQVSGNDRYVWSSPQLISDVANWVASPAANFGWIVLGNESTNTTAKRFDSREHTTVANRPKLIIDFDAGDTTRPTPTISGPSNPTSSDPFDVTIGFGEAVNGFVANDITVAGGSVTNLADNGNGNFTATIDASADGNLTVDIAADVASDTAGNLNNEASQFSLTVDTQGPTPTITGPASPTSTDPFDITIVFGEIVTGFLASDITVNGGSVTNLADNGNGNFTATIDASADGSVTVDIVSSAVADTAGNVSDAATQFSITVDTTGATPTISGPAGPISTEPFDVTIDFGEAVTGFFVNDIVVGNGNVSNFVDNAGGTFTVTIDAAADGNVTVDVAAAAAIDSDGKATGAASQYSVTVDTTGPTPTISGPASPTSTEPFDVTIAFGEAVTDFVSGDITVAGGNVTNFVDNSNGNFTATIDATTDGDVTVDIAVSIATDTAGNTSNAAAQFSVTVDTTSPTPAISGPASPTGSDPFDVTIAFGEPASDFDAGDITVGNGTVTNLSDDGNGDFTASIDATSDGDVTVDIAAGVATDTAGNPNNAAGQFSITVDTTSPTPTISGPADPTSTEPFDVTIAFGEPVADFVSGDIAVGNGTVTNLADNGNGDFTATIDATTDGSVTIDIAAGVATDTAGNTNSAAAQFTITIDTTSPEITVPADIDVEGDTTGGANATNSEITAFIAAATASDTVDADPAITSDSPALFPLGGTLVTFTATDDSGNTATASATVTVVDTTVPDVTAPADIIVVADVAGGANATDADIVAFLAAAIVNDTVDASPTIANDAPALFPFGDTLVTFTATDSSGNSGTATATVSVVSSAPPMVTFRAPAGADDPADLPSGSQPTSWSIQRSDLREIVIDFSDPISLPTASDLVLTNLGINASLDPDVIIALRDDQLSLSVDATQLRITLDPNQLADGVYQLELLSAITGGDPFTIVGDETNELYVLTGDWNGSGGVNIQDFATFAYWFGHPLPTAPDYTDVNGSGGVNIQDFAGFAANFGNSIVFPGASAGLVAGGEGELLSAMRTLLNPTDVNGDGSVTARDALNVMNEIAREGSVVPEAWSRFDANGDGNITLNDALFVINQLAKPATKSPAGLQIQELTGVADVDSPRVLEETRLPASIKPRRIPMADVAVARAALIEAIDAVIAGEDVSEDMSLDSLIDLLSHHRTR